MLILTYFFIYFNFYSFVTFNLLLFYNITHPTSNKIDSVRYIQSLLGISDDSVITVGDAKDDLEMIKNYHSYVIVIYLPNFEVLGNCDVKVKSLNDAFKYINKNI